MTSGPNSSDSPAEKILPGLTEKIMRFSEHLKRRGFKVSHSAVGDALCSVLQIDPFIREDFFESLRTSLAKNDEEWHRFGDLFHEFWDRPADAPERSLDAESPDASPIDPSAACNTGFESVSEQSSAQAAAGRAGTGAETAYSPRPAAEKKLMACFGKTDIPLAACALKNLLTPFRPDESRRFKKTLKRTDIDFPLTLRRSLRYEGLPLDLLYKTRKKKLKRVVFLIDVSGSMDRYARMVLPFILSLRTVASKAEIFVFSTALAKITFFVRRLHASQVMDYICRHVPDWSGGTRIGQSLHQFNRNHGRQLVSRQTVVIILSDGWDLGEKELLRQEMSALHRRANRIIWLNPLAGEPDYRPLCQGMKTALPYIDYLLPADTLDNLKKAGHLLSRLLFR